ncbi:MAG: exonuclease subunit SbcD [Clostridia bacterium]
MKFIHLSDMHLGKVVLEQNMIEDQQYILDQIIEFTKNENIDSVLISGDIYDRGIPPIEAVNMLDNFLTCLINDNKKVFIISGNHDSKDRLNFASCMLHEKGLYIESKFQGKLACHKVFDEYGCINIYMLPYVKPIDVSMYFQLEDDSYR